MKKRMTTALLMVTAMISFYSCNPVQEIDVDFGSKQYVNEYKGLIDAVNDLKESLGNRFDALNDAISNGLAGVKIAVDGTNSTLQVLNTTTADGFNSVNTSIFDGFKAVNNTLADMIVAMDENGNLLRLQLDATGNLLNATLISSLEALRAQMKNNNTDLTEKLVLIEAALKTGFANVFEGQDFIRVAIEALTAEVDAGNTSADAALAKIEAAIKAQDLNLRTKLGLIDESIKAGFAKSVDVQVMIGNAIANIDLTDLTNAITSQTTSLETKLTAIKKALSSGLTDVKNANILIKTAIETLAGKVEAGTTTLDGALDEIKTAIGSINTDLSTDLAAITSAVQTGLADVVTAEGLITKAINKLKNSVETGFANEVTAIGNLVTAVNNNTTAMDTIINDGNLKEALVAINVSLVNMLADSGLYFDTDPNTKLPLRTHLYMAPSLWTAVMSNDTTKAIMEDALDGTLDGILPTFTIYQLDDNLQKTDDITTLNQYASSGTNPGHLHHNEVSGSAESISQSDTHMGLNLHDYGFQLYSDMYQTTCAASNGKNVVKVFKVCERVKLEIWIAYGMCSSPKINWVTVEGAKGVQIASDLQTEYQFKRYDDETGAETTNVEDHGHVEFIVPCYYTNPDTGETTIKTHINVWLGTSGSWN